jgi:hypothetical protein
VTYEDSIRILLRGTCGANPHEIARVTGMRDETVRRFLENRGEPRRDSLDAIGLFVFRRMNAHCVIGPEDLEGACTCRN